MADHVNWERFLVFIEGTLVEKWTWEILDFTINETHNLTKGFGFWSSSKPERSDAWLGNFNWVLNAMINTDMLGEIYS